MVRLLDYGLFCRECRKDDLKVAHVSTAARDEMAGAVDCTGAIDSDVHPYFREGLRDLGPYLDESMKRRLGLWHGRRGMQIPRPKYPNPEGVLRPDATPPGGGPPCSDPHFAATDHLERYGLRASVLIPGDALFLGNVPDADLAAELAFASNAWLADEWLSKDPRYKGSVITAPQDPTKAAREVERWAADERFVQVLIPEYTVALGKRYFYPIYEAATQHGFPVAMHISGSGRTAVDEPSFYIDCHTGSCQAFQAHTISLVAEGVFDRFPTLKVGLIEGGFAWLAELMWRFDKNWKSLRSSVPWIKRLPSEYIKEHMRFTTQPMYEPSDPSQLLQLIEIIEGDRVLMFSTDYPHWDGDNPAFAYRTFPQSMRQKLFVDNPLSFYRT